MALTEHDKHLVAEARRIGPALRASTSERDRLAGWLLKELADLAEQRGRDDPDLYEPPSGHHCKTCGVDV